jgi:ribosomal protein L14
MSCGASPPHASVRSRHISVPRSIPVFPRSLQGPSNPRRNDTASRADPEPPLPIGDRIIVVVKRQRNFGPESGPGGSVSVSAANKVRRGDVRHAVVVRCAKEQQRKDGSSVRFADNACVLIGKGGEPIGSRFSSIVGAELRDKKWSKILSLAPMHL